MGGRPILLPHRLLGFRAPDGDDHGTYVEGTTPDLMDHYGKSDGYTRDWVLKPETVGRVFLGKTIKPGATIKLGEVLTNRIRSKGY